MTAFTLAKENISFQKYRPIILEYGKNTANRKRLTKSSQNYTMTIMNNDEFRHKASGHYPSFILTYNINTGDLSKNNIGIYPNPMEVDTQEFKMILFGSPIVKNIVNKKDVISKVLLHRKLDQSYIKTINGEFLIILIDKKKNTLSIANDRFSSIQLYYYQNKKEVILSFAYLDILKIVKNIY